MKKIIIAIMAIAFISHNVYGQVSLPKDFAKRLEQLRNNPQLADTIMGGDSVSVKVKEEPECIDSVLINFVQKSTFLLRQDYCLYNKKEDELYGYNDQEQFGTTYALGIKCNGFNIISDSSVHPWEYDEKYDQFKSNKLTPQITKSWYRFVCDTTSSSYSQLDTIVTSRKIIKENSYYTSAPFTSSQEGFCLNTEDTCKTGTLVWLVIENGNIESDDITVNLVFNQIDIEMFGTKTVNQPIGKHAIGGFFVVKTEKTGNDFQLAGMLAKTDADWFLEFPFKGFRNENEEKSERPGKLTKITKSNSKKK